MNGVAVGYYILVKTTIDVHNNDFLNIESLLLSTLEALRAVYIKLGSHWPWHSLQMSCANYSFSHPTAYLGSCPQS